MNLPTEMKRKNILKKMLPNHLGVSVIILNQKQGFLMTQMVFLTLMVSSNFSTKVGHLEQLTV